MKKRITFLLFIVNVCTIFSQTVKYIPFVSPLNVWVADYDALIKDPKDEFIRFSFSKDSTLHKGKYYKQLVYSTKVTGELDKKGGFMREDNGKIYSFNVKDSTERLIYNMHYNIGDKIAGNPNYAKPPATIINVGTTKLADNIPRKFYTYAFDTICTTLKITIIEGIGDPKGFLEDFYCSSADDGFLEIRCFSTDGMQLYKRANVSNCFSTQTKDITSNDFKIFPNPATSLINIHSVDLPNADCTWQLFDLQNRLIYTQLLYNEHINFNLPTSLPQGIYFWRVFSGVQQLGQGKLVIVD